MECRSQIRHYGHTTQGGHEPERDVNVGVGRRRGQAPDRAQVLSNRPQGPADQGGADRLVQTEVPHDDAGVLVIERCHGVEQLPNAPGFETHLGVEDRDLADRLGSHRIPTPKAGAMTEAIGPYADVEPLGITVDHDLGELEGHMPPGVSAVRRRHRDRNEAIRRL